MTISVRVAAAEDAEDWRQFVDDQRGATLFHDWRWSGAIRRSFGHDTPFLIARRDHHVCGVLPLVHLRSPLFGTALISTAFTVGGGVLATDSEAGAELALYARQLGATLGVQYVELRAADNLYSEWELKAGAYVGFAAPMAETSQTRLSAIPRKRRAEVRKGLALLDGGDVHVTHKATADQFYTLYAQSLRSLGTPVFTRRWPAQLNDAFGDQIIFTVVSHRDQPAFSVASFRFRDRIMPYFAGVTPMARRVKAADLGYFSLMDHAADHGARVFDFGRSKVGAPHADYKKSWGFMPDPIEYQYALVKGTQTPDVNPNNPKYAMLSRAWKRLPTPVANRIGPVIARQLG